MLKISDTSVVEVLRDCTAMNLEVAFLVPTETGLKKSILDAHASLRDFLSASGLHDYGQQGQGQTEKRLLQAIWWSPQGSDEISLSLYRPNTKKGDPRLWIRGLATRVAPRNLLIFALSSTGLVVMNASDPATRAALAAGDGELRALLQPAEARFRDATSKLTESLRVVYEMGFVDSLRAGDTGVGYTLETLLGISANASKEPDFLGIELKAGRRRHEKATATSRQTLFSQVPDWDISRCASGAEIVQRFGRFNEAKGRMELYHTLGAVPNSFGLFLRNRNDHGTVLALKTGRETDHPVVQWRYERLKQRLLKKHRSTCWVEAITRRTPTGSEQFYYHRASITGSPYASHLPTLVELGVLTVDFTISQRSETTVRDHGYLWRMKQEHMSLLFPEPRELVLNA